MQAVGGAIERIGKRRGRGVALVAKGCERFLSGYYNADVNMATNGEAWLIEALASDRPRVALDVGANRGDWSTAYLAANIAAVSHAFEPVPETYQSLVARAGRCGRFRPVLAALSERQGQGEVFHDSAEPHFSSLLSARRFNVALKAEPVPVSLMRGDTYCAVAAISHVDFLKVDTEGHDLAVLKGFSSMIGAAAIDVIQFERNYATLFARATLADFFELLEPAYALFRLLPRRLEAIDYHPTIDDFRQANFVALERKILANGAFAALVRR